MTVIIGGLLLGSAVVCHAVAVEVSAFAVEPYAAGRRFKSRPGRLMFKAGNYTADARWFTVQNLDQNLVCTGSSTRKLLVVI